VTPLDIGLDASAIMRVCGPGRVRAVFEPAIYLDLPGGLVVLTTPALPRGPLHVRVRRLPVVSPGDVASVGDGALRIADQLFALAAPVWAPRLPTPAALAAARGVARAWLPSAAPVLDVTGLVPEVLPSGVVAALRQADLAGLGALLGGRGPGLTPAGDDMLAGVLLVARAIRGELPAGGDLLRGVATNDIARAFLRCAVEGRCIEPAHDLLDALARADEGATDRALAALSRFGSSSGAALTYGIRAALLELSTAGFYRQARAQLVWSIDKSDIKRELRPACRLKSRTTKG
jgi:hypothetical protein